MSDDLPAERERRAAREALYSITEKTIGGHIHPLNHRANPFTSVPPFTLICRKDFELLIYKRACKAPDTAESACAAGLRDGRRAEMMPYCAVHCSDTAVCVWGVGFGATGTIMED